MLEVHVKDGLNCPMAVCDICGTPLTEASKAAAVFPNFMPEGSKVPVLLVHKGRIDDRTCHAQAEVQLRAQGHDPGWEELTTFLPDLAHNAGMKLERREKRAV